MGENNNMSENLKNRWSQIEERINLQSIGEFIRTGRCAGIEHNSFNERLDRAYKLLRDYIEDNCGKDRADDIIEYINTYSVIREDISFSIGMKTGAQLAVQLTENFEADF